jgi:hypothetical protein
VLACIFGGMSESEAKRQNRKASGLAIAGQVIGVLRVIGAIVLYTHHR